MPAMQFISASLGVDCEYCHVERQMDKDDKKEKVTARKMIAMTLAINRESFDGRKEVTCYSCHRGMARPALDSRGREGWRRTGGRGAPRRPSCLPLARSWRSTCWPLAGPKRWGGSRAACRRGR